MIYPYKNREFHIQRYPKTFDRSLTPINAGDEHVLKYLDEGNIDLKSVVIYNDRFGFLTVLLQDHNPLTVICHKSQEKACGINLDRNGFTASSESFVTPLTEISTKVDLALIKIPKSMDLFRLYLFQLSKCIDTDGTVVCSFMTKYFSPQMVSVAETFFDDVSQSRAFKKSRVLILKNPKPFKEINILKSVALNDDAYQQYFGVFSSDHIDYATQFFMDHIKIERPDGRVLDLASGNGVIAHSVHKYVPEGEIHLLDDSYLAVESSKLNFRNGDIHFHFNDCLEAFEDDYFDLVVSNPPFHFEYEINKEVSVGLFKEVARCLNRGGSFQLVANKHLNYNVVLARYFTSVSVLAANQKFAVYECKKV